MSAPIKRKRGRPRLDEPREIKDFDNNLIQEFKKFPVFYDRQHAQHRNREFTDRIWQRLAQNLNVSTNLVKTRMLQLRNRFNLEKRRLEAMREQQPNVPITSQWSLYDNLSFLSDYVKTRRPYSLPSNFNANKMDTNSSDAEEEDEEDGDDDETKNQESMDNVLNSNQMLLNGHILSSGGNGVPNAHQAESNRNHSTITTANNAANQQIPLPIQNNHLDLNNHDVSSNNKYKAFGQFLASSLIEMNEIQALNLVQKFTTDLVKYLKIEERNKHFNTQQNNVVDNESDDISANGY